ncbi:MAG TPA: hypothetical protein VHM91_19445 [Verrucomicrobiales bacterium]|nr:hypothetical protein [Verrucomicrobiales bacterium]
MRSGLLTLSLLPFLCQTAAATVYSIIAGADAFMRSAAPDSNYGRGGLLSVSGATATNSLNTANGSYDVFLRFATAATRTQIDAEFGAGLWRITAVSLNLTEVTNPGNAIFNKGAGQFQVQWISGDGWEEGTGNPNIPGFTGITWNTRAAFLDAGTDRSLGTFENPVLGGTLTSTLAPDGAFLADLMNDVQTSLSLTAATATTGFNFRSRDFAGDASVLPQLQLTVEAIPEPSVPGLCALLLSGLVRHRRSR